MKKVISKDRTEIGGKKYLFKRKIDRRVCFPLSLLFFFFALLLSRCGKQTRGGKKEQGMGRKGIDMKRLNERTNERM